MKSEDYFDKIWGRIAYAQGAYWRNIDFDDTSWRKIALGFYWRAK